ncbi:MAG: DNA repair protein RecN [Gammaproteobacteria bacterium]|nr:DNA repair protein RecN [Gammaproteobacteria bacterium]
MLKKLTVQNFAIIENIEIEFKDGLTVLTGETGAGKSLIIDSLSLLLGERASLEMIRTGYDKAIIIGYFSINNIHLNSLLSSLNIDIIDNELVIERCISKSKSYIKVNGVNVSLQELKLISKYSADIHMQFDNEKILNKENYLEIIDNFRYDLTASYLSEYKKLYEIFIEDKEDYKRLLKTKAEIEEKRDILEYELKELENANLVVGEEDDLNNELEILKNFDKIYSLFEELNALVREDFNDKLYRTKEIVKNISEYNKEYSEAYEKLNDYYYEIDSLFDTFKKDFNKLDYDPNRLDNIESRKVELDNLKKKYKKNILELIEYKDNLKGMLKSDNNIDEQLEESRKRLSSSYDALYTKAKDLSLIRKEISKSIKKELEKNMEDLSLKAHFEVVFNEVKKEKDLSGEIFRSDGIDEVDFLIETNIGEGLKTLSKTISGGETSRISLAIKSLFIKSEKIPTVIFDEIDTGISGEIARKVALKIYEISLSTQVIVITHLPQVAAMSKNHIKISKSVNKGRTYTSIKELSLDEKIYEIALMISGGNVTESQLSYAKELVLGK